MHRLKGEVALLEADEQAAEDAFRLAIGVAQSQHSKAWELRAATSLAKFRKRQNRCREARDLLSPVYTWFTEGFGTADLKAAKTLLDELDALSG